MNEEYILPSKNDNKKILTGIFCSNCELTFKTQIEHKVHYKSDFHAYNLKRRMVNLSAISHEDFEKNLQRYKTSIKKETDFKKKEKNNYCQVCYKNFKSIETYRQHLKSKKHSVNEKNKKNIIKKDKISISDTALKNPNICLFCNLKFENEEKNFSHMKKKHSFFICDETNCISKIDIIKILAEKIFVNFECIFCNIVKDKNFKSFGDVQKHMTDVGHCMMNQDDFGEFKKFYDYAEDNQKIIEKYILNENGSFKFTKEDLEEFEIIEIAGEDEEVENPEEWVSVSEEELENFTKIDKEGQDLKDDKIDNDDQKDLISKILDPKKQYDLRRFVMSKSKKLFNGELKLPNEKILGNKKYALYYNQNYREYFDLKKMKKFLTDNKVISDSKALIEAPYGQVKKMYLQAYKLENSKKSKVMKDLNKKNEKIRIRLMKNHQKREYNTFKKHNKVLTTYHKDQTLIWG